MSDFINSTVNTKTYNLMSDEHQIITITDKEAIVENIGTIVSGDTNSCLLTFEINRFQDGIDLSDKKIRFNYKNSNGKFYDIAVNVKYNDDVIRFSWLLPYSLTQPGGNVIASIEFYGYIEYDEEYSYKTKNFKLSVEKSLGVDDDRPDESYNNWAIKIDNSVETIQKKIIEIEKDINDIYVPTKLSEMDDDVEHRTVSDSQIQAWNEAQKNIQSDWNEQDTNSDAYIKNKPQITNDLTDELKSSYDEAVDKKHTHSNMSVLDGITYENIESWNNKSEFDGQYSSLQGIPNDIATETYVNEKIKNKVNDGDLATVAKTGSYNDLNDTPTSLPASDVYQWAKEPEKPTYTADEVGALPDTTQIPSIDDVSENTRVRHEHSNKTVLDSIDNQYTEKWNSAYSHSISSHAPENAQENIIEDIKINGVSTAISDKTVNITTPTKTSDITNDSGFITNIANNLVNYYLKSEIYTKEEVQSLISRVSSLELIKVDVLPTENIKTSAIYLIPKDQIEENNIYTEYIYMDGKWEIIGDTSVDLSQYALNKDVNELRGELDKKFNISDRTHYTSEENPSIMSINGLGGYSYNAVDYSYTIGFVNLKKVKIDIYGISSKKYLYSGLFELQKRVINGGVSYSYYWFGNHELSRNDENEYYNFSDDESKYPSAPVCFYKVIDETTGVSNQYRIAFNESLLDETDKYGAYRLDIYDGDRTVTVYHKLDVNYLPMDSELSDSSSNPVENRVVKAELDKKITSPDTAEVGQTIIVKSVDSNGKPTEWEAVDLHNNEKFIITFSGSGTTDSPYVCDKTWNEIDNAYENGQDISAVFTGVSPDGNTYTNLPLVLNSYDRHAYIEFQSDLENYDLHRLTVYLSGDGICGIDDQSALDNTLTYDGKAADALAVGTRFSEIETRLSEAEKPTDWNQNDETQIDYIKNRPFYDIITQEDIIAEQTKSFTYSSSNNWYTTDVMDKKTLTDGVSCKILWDGTVYDVVSKEESYPCFGDKNFIEYPFYFILSVSEASGEIYGYDIYTNDTSSSHTFRVYTEKTDVKCIDEKYLPFTSETFTFTLEDGTEIVKEVYVKS